MTDAKVKIRNKDLGPYVVTLLIGTKVTNSTSVGEKPL